jgi:hypothetical protein
VALHGLLFARGTGLIAGSLHDLCLVEGSRALLLYRELFAHYVVAVTSLACCRQTPPPWLAASDAVQVTTNEVRYYRVLKYVAVDLDVMKKAVAAAAPAAASPASQAALLAAEYRLLYLLRRGSHKTALEIATGNAIFGLTGVSAAVEAIFAATVEIKNKPKPNAELVAAVENQFWETTKPPTEADLTTVLRTPEWATFLPVGLS